MSCCLGDTSTLGPGYVRPCTKHKVLPCNSGLCACCLIRNRMALHLVVLRPDASLFWNSNAAIYCTHVRMRSVHQKIEIHCAGEGLQRAVGLSFLSVQMISQDAGGSYWIAPSHLCFKLLITVTSRIWLIALITKPLASNPIKRQFHHFCACKKTCLYLYKLFFASL